jgi:hypothetical protein
MSERGGPVFQENKDSRGGTRAPQVLGPIWVQPQKRPSRFVSFLTATGTLRLQPQGSFAIGSIVVQPRRRASEWSLAFPAIDVRVVALAAILLVATVLRVWHINSIGYNSDEAVYVGQGAAIAHIQGLSDLFPAFRAHPLLVQFLVSLILKVSTNDLYPRLLAAGFGVGTVYLTYATGKLMYGSFVGLVAALFLSLMPYHVIVTRQILLDGPMTFFVTLCLYFTARYANSTNKGWLYASALALGLACLAKETAVVILGSVYVFLVLSPALKLRIRDIVLYFAVFALTLIPYPTSILLAGRSHTAGNFLTWQLLRRPNHTMDFYILNVPQSIGILVVIAAVLGLIVLRKNRTWRDVLLLSWILVPICFFQLWQVKGFQYLLPIAPAVAVLAGKAVHILSEKATLFRFREHVLTGATAATVALGLIGLSLFYSTAGTISQTNGYKGLAGSGGVPAGRETGEWIARNTPEGSTFMTIGPSMANIVEYYGRRKALGLAISPNPLRRNPSYDPIPNPDAALRTGDINYIVWDAYSAQRSSFFSEKVLEYAARYHGRIVYTGKTTWSSAGGTQEDAAVIVVYEVRP